jgi:hypothetical protein
MHHKELYKAVTIPLSIVFVGIWLTYLFTNYHKAEEILITILGNKSWPSAILLLISLLLILIPFYLFQLSFGVINKKDKMKLLDSIGEKTESEYEANRQNYLIKEFDKIISGYASRGYTLPPGMMASDIAELYVKDVIKMSAIIESAIKEATTSTGVKFIAGDIINFIDNRLNTHNSRMKASFDKVIKNYYNNISSSHADIMRESFAMKIDSATNSRIRSLKSSVNIGKFA